MLDVVLAGISGLVLAVLLSKPPKRPVTPASDEEIVPAAAGRNGGKAGQGKRGR